MLQPPKDVVAGAVYAKNCVEWVLCRAVCAVMGLRFSPINWHLVASEVAYIVHDCDADMVFYTKEFAQNVAMMRASAPTVKTWVCMDGVVEGSAREGTTTQPSWRFCVLHWWNNRKAKGCCARQTCGEPGARDVQVLRGGFMRMMPEPIELVCAPM